MTMGMWNDENGEKCLTKNIIPDFVRWIDLCMGIFCQVDFVNVKPSIVCKSEIAFEHLWIVDPFALKLILKFFLKSVEINRHLPILKALCNI